MAIYEELKTRLRSYNGLHLKPYHAAGRLKIGIGRNLDDFGITEEEAEILIENDLVRCEHALLSIFGGTFYGGSGPENVPSRLSQERKNVLLEMVFTLGVDQFKKFDVMIDAIKMENFQWAADAMANLFALVGESRACRLINALQEG